MPSIINGFIIFSLTVTQIYLFGLLTFINDYEKNTCEMVYMYEYPQFVRISQEIDNKYPKYSLYAYSEGRLTEKHRNKYFAGIPILFIPGNSGSHRQGRSLSSIALRKSLSSLSNPHFDHFTVHLNNELSGLNGAVLEDQLEYVSNSISTILELYKKNEIRPKSVILFAHSLGGVIARRLIASLPSDSDLVPIVLTLATPFKRPPVMLDWYIYRFYKMSNVNQTKTNFISISGGYDDFMVPSFLTVLPNDFSVATTHIPRSWQTSDHKCITWCKQTILVLNRVLYDCVDPKTRQISHDNDFRKKIINHHLVHHNGLNAHLRDKYNDSTTNIKNWGEWIEYLDRQYTVNISRHIQSTKFYMLRLIEQPQNEIATVVALNLETVEWAFVCGAHIPRDNFRVCEKFTHLSHLTELTPSANYKRRTLRVNMHQLLQKNPNWSHVVLRVLPSDEEVMLHVDIHRDDRKLTLTLPHILSLKRQFVIEKTPEKILEYDLEVPNLYHVIQYYQLFVEPVRCANLMQHATASLMVPWGHHNQHKHFTNDNEKPFNVRLYESRPLWASNQSAVIRLTFDPMCQYKVSIKSSIPGVLAQLARFYSPLLLVNIAAVVLMALTSQLKNMASDRQCSFFFVAIKEGAKPYYILTIVKLVSRFLSFKPILNFFPPPDWLIMSQEGTDFFLLPLLLYICSVGIVWILGILLCASLVVCETTVHKMTLKFLAKTVSFTISWSDHVMSALHKLPFLVACTLMFLSLTTSGGLALCVGTVFYFLRLTQMSQDYVEQLVWHYVQKFAKFKKRKEKDGDAGNTDKENETTIHDVMFFHLTIFILWVIVAMINVPSALTWAHNFKFDIKLSPDPAFLPGIVLSMCALPLWQFDLPKIQKKGYTEIGQFISVLAVVSLIYAPISIYRLNYTLTGAIATVTIHQLVAPNRPEQGEEKEKAPISYETVKAKLE